MAAILAAILMVPWLILQYNQHFETTQSVCPLKALTGFPCPGCGITKSIIFFYKGEITTSISYHILGIPATIFSAVALVLIITLRKIPAWMKNIFFNMKLGIAFAAFLFIYHLIRLLHFAYTHSIDDILRESIWK